MHALYLNAQERSALYGLSHFCQVLYIMGLKPYMNYQDATVGGAKRRISLQSLRETFYVEPERGRCNTGSSSNLARLKKLAEIQSGVKEGKETATTSAQISTHPAPAENPVRMSEAANIAVSETMKETLKTAPIFMMNLRGKRSVVHPLLATICSNARSRKKMQRLEVF